MTRSMLSGIMSAVMAVGFVWADTEGVTLTTDKPVYKVGPTGGPVTITIKNTSSETVPIVNDPPFKVVTTQKQVLYPSLVKKVVLSLEPGASMTFYWKKKGLNGEFVKPGSYTIVLNTASTSRTIALTPTGTIASKSPFPLSVGNQWEYNNHYNTISGQPKVLKVTDSTVQGMAVWYKTSNLLDGDPWVTLVGTKKPTLRMGIPNGITNLFQFGQPKGHSYSVYGFAWTNGGMKVGATNEKVVTPAGTFMNCYRLDVTKTIVADDGYSQFWFAPGIGLVQYSTFWIGGSQIHALERAAIKGTDGKVYTISAK